MSGPVRLERILPFLTLTVFLDLVGFGIILPLLPSYVGEMGGSATTVGILFASFAASQFVATPTLGRISDRFGRRRVILVSLGANAVAMFLFSIAASRHALWLLFASRIVAGATSGNIGACQAAIADVVGGADRTRAMGKLGAGIGLGMMLGPWIGGRVSTLGEVAPPIAAGILATVALVGVLFFMPETNPSVVAAERAHVPTQRPKLELRHLASNPKILVVMALYFLTFFYMTNLQTALALLASDRFHWKKEHVGDLFGLFGAVTLVVQFGIVGPVSTRFAARSAVAGAAILSAVGLLVIGFSPVSPAMVTGMVILALGLGLTQPLLASLASQYAGPGQQGTVLGFAQSSGSLARALGPLLWGAMYQHLGPIASFVGGSVAALAVCVVSIAGGRTAPETTTAP
ncbi:MAG TPA: MFS transporter [Polyangiaceae bacterium]